VADDLAGDPFALWVDRGLAVVLYMGVGFAAIAAVSLLTVTAARRRRDLGYLRTLGLAPSQATAITVWEQMPTVLLATGVGAVTGALTARLLAPALDIESFTGGLFPAEIVVEPLPIIVTTAVVMAVLGVAVAIFVLATRTEDYGRLLKVGDE
jgi:putative ABC transport system permease protein